METKYHMCSVGINSAFDQTMEKAVYNTKFNTLLLLCQTKVSTQCKKVK